MLTVTKSLLSGQASPTGSLGGAAAEDIQRPTVSSGRSVTRRVFIAGSLAALGSSQLSFPAEPEVVGYRRQSLQRPDQNPIAPSVTVTQSVFSGRENPAAMKNTGDPIIKDLLQEIAANQDGITTAMKPRARGKTPFIFTFNRGVPPRGLPRTFYVGDGYAKDAALSERLFRKVKDSIPLVIPTNSPGVACYDTSEANLRDDKGPYPRSDWANDNRVLVQLASYLPAYWNNSPTRLPGNNCFAYACNITTQGGTERYWPHPGFRKRGTIPTGDNDLTAGIAADGIFSTGDPANHIRGSESNPAWIVAVTSGQPVTRPESWDYHLYRKVWSHPLREYVWGHKPGVHPVEYVRDNVADAPLEDAKRRGYTGRYGSNGYCTIYHNIVCGGTG